MLANERRLLAMESELETARRIQSSILPESIPGMPGLRIAAAYRPMSAVAGDFYQFIPVDPQRLGVLVADVAGHGVPAALIFIDDQGRHAVDRIDRARSGRSVEKPQPVSFTRAARPTDLCGLPVD